jgi:hypothetical protein
VPPRDPQPRFFIDRSLGRVAVPAALRDDGWDVVTLAEHYGMPRDEEVADTEWIADAASRDWAILMKGPCRGGLGGALIDWRFVCVSR